MNAVIAKTQGKRRILTGIATTPAPDRMGDVVEPLGAEYKLPLPLLWQHDHAKPVGWVRSATVSADGIRITAEVARGAGHADEAWGLIEAGLVGAYSIGFRALEAKPHKGGMRFIRWEWVETSLVTIPAHPDALIGTHAERTAGQVLVMPRRSVERPALRILPRKS